MFINTRVIGKSEKKKHSDRVYIADHALLENNTLQDDRYSWWHKIALKELW
jgi:hypothetical protein